MPLSTITDDPLGLSCLYLALPRPPLSTLFPYTTLFRSHSDAAGTTVREPHRLRGEHGQPGSPDPQRSGVVPPYVGLGGGPERRGPGRDAGRARELRADGCGRRCELRGPRLGNTRLKRRELGVARAQEARRTAAPVWAPSPTPRA